MWTFSLPFPSTTTALIHLSTGPDRLPLELLMVEGMQWVKIDLCGVILRENRDRHW